MTHLPCTATFWTEARSEFLRHEFERSGVAGGLNNGHERFHAELCAGVKRIGFPEQGRVGLADGDSNGFCLYRSSGELRGRRKWFRRR